MDLLEINNRLQAIEKALTENKTIFTPEEAARYLAISKSTLYKFTSAGIIPFSKPNGKLIYFEKVALDNWILSNPSKSNEIKEAEAATHVVIH